MISILFLLTISSAIDYMAVRKDIEAILPNPSADSGNLGPRLIRLAWHCSGTYRTTDGRGGCDGARIRFDPEINWADNAGQAGAMKFLEPIKIKYGDELSWGDLIILAANTAIHVHDGPEIKMCTGKIDVDDGSESRDWLTPTSITSETFLIYVNPKVDGPDQVRKVFGYMDMNDTETVALIGGGHAFGKCHATRSSFEGAWTTNATYFDNQFFHFLANVLNGSMVYTKNETTKQYDSTFDNKKVLMLHTDLALINDTKYIPIVRQMADDYDYYFDMFNHSWTKLVYRDFGNKGCAEDDFPVSELITNYDQKYWDGIAKEISDIYLNGDMDDAPLLVRLAWQCAGTFRGTDYRGGCDGARIRFNPENSWAANNGINDALDLLRNISEKHANDRHPPSWADLIILAGTQALKDMGLDLEMPFCPGRVDVMSESEAKEGSKYLETSFLDPEFGRDGDDRSLEIQIKDRASMMNFTLREMVVLNGGGHSIGKCHSAVSGYAGKWTSNPTEFDNSWFKQVLQVQDALGALDEKWEKKTLENGRSQWVNKADPTLMMLHSDLAHTKDPILRKIVTDYAGNNDKFLRDFRDAWLKLVNSDRYGNVCATRSINNNARSGDDSEDKDYLSNLALVLISLLGGLLFCTLLALGCCYCRTKDSETSYKKFGSLNQ